MRKFVLLFFLLMVQYSMYAQQAEKNEKHVSNNALYEAKVNELYEYHGIIWHLAGVDAGYNNVYIPSYLAAVDKYFEKHREHELIKFCSVLRNTNRIAHSAVTQVASLTEIADGGIRMVKNCDPNTVSQADPRWTPADFIKYVSLADKFYRETDFHRFFESQSYMYAEAEKWFDKLICSRLPDMSWLEHCFGTKPDKCHINIGLINEGNYAILNNNLKDKNEIALLFGCAWTYDDPSQNIYFPVFYHSEKAIVVLHEVMHSFINPLMEKYKADFADAVNKIWPHLKTRLTYNSYGFIDAITHEGFVRTMTLYFAKELGYPQTIIDNQMDEDHDTGFPWQHAALNFIETEFGQNRDKYPTFESFIPQVVHFMDTVADNLHHYAQVNYGAPTVVSVSPDTNAVYRYCDIDTFVVTVKFSDDMEYMSALGLLGDDPEAIRKVVSEWGALGLGWYYSVVHNWVDVRTIRIHLTRQMLLDSKATGIRLCSGYRNGLGNELGRDVNLNYKFVECDN